MTDTTPTPGATKSPVGAVLDVFVFAPLGFALDARELMPKLAERGRNQFALLKVVGQFVVNKGRADADRKLQPKPPASPAPQPTPGAARTPPATRIRPTATTATRATTASALPINNYDTLSASQIVPLLAGLRPEELARVRSYENAHRRRRTILGRIAQLQGRH
jgi:hypothetical protein